MPTYRGRPDDAEPLCYCIGVSKGALRKAIAEDGAESIEDLARCTGAMGGCMTCRWDLQDLLKREGEELRRLG